MVTALQISRVIREPSYRAPAPGSPPPPAFLVMPTTVARAAVRIYHDPAGGAGAATKYLNGKLGPWLAHSNASMAGNARNTTDGLAHYIAADVADGRSVLDLDRKIIVRLPSGPVQVRFDVVLNDRNGVAGRVVLWDGPNFRPADGPLMAAVYAEGLQRLYPQDKLTTVGIWQARRNQTVEISYSLAQAQLPAADRIRASL